MKHPGRVVQGHKLAALIKKKKEELKQNREAVESSIKTSTEHSTSQSNTGARALAVLAIGVGVWYARSPAQGAAPTNSDRSAKLQTHSLAKPVLGATANENLMI